MSASPLVCLLFLLSLGRFLSAIKLDDVIQDIIKSESITSHSMNTI